MRPRCPSCGSKHIGIPIPKGVVIVHDDDGRTTVATSEGRFLDFLECDTTAATCLDCGDVFDAEEQADRVRSRALRAVR